MSASVSPRARTRIPTATRRDRWAAPGNRNYFDANFGVSGGQTTSNDVLLDGVSDTVGDFNGIAVSPPQDSVQEFKVMSGVFSAEYGRTGGGVVNFVTKAGGKDYHGSGYEYFQNGALNANGWQRNRAGYGPDGVTMRLPRIPVKRSQFGGTIGGPVPVITAWAKNTFFFFNYEGRQEPNPYSKHPHRADPEDAHRGSLRVAAAGGALGRPAERRRLAALVWAALRPLRAHRSQPQWHHGAAGDSRQPLDLLPKCGSGPRLAVLPRPGALNVMKYIPLPNQPGLTDNYVYSGTTPFSSATFSPPAWTGPSRTATAFSAASATRSATSRTPTTSASMATNGRTHSGHLFQHHIQRCVHAGPWAINNFRYGYTRAHAHQINFGQAGNFDPTTLGFPPYLRATSALGGFPLFSVSRARGRNRRGFLAKSPPATSAPTAATTSLGTPTTWPTASPCFTAPIPSRWERSTGCCAFSPTRTEPARELHL